jgi:hypothetical protein
MSFLKLWRRDLYHSKIFIVVMVLIWNRDHDTWGEYPKVRFEVLMFLRMLIYNSFNYLVIRPILFYFSGGSTSTRQI